MFSFQFLNMNKLGKRAFSFDTKLDNLISNRMFTFFLEFFGGRDVDKSVTIYLIYMIKKMWRKMIRYNTYNSSCLKC